jgi:hypothetical protein
MTDRRSRPTPPRLDPLAQPNDETVRQAALMWNRLAEKRRGEAYAELRRLSPEVHAEIDPALVQVLWSDAAKNLPTDAVQILPVLSERSRAALPRDEVLRAWNATARWSFDKALAVLSWLPGFTPAEHDRIAVSAWRGEALWTSFRDLLLLSPAQRALLERERMNASWRCFAEKDAGSAFHLLAELPADLTGLISPADVEAVVRDRIESPRDKDDQGLALWRFESIPDAFVTPYVQDALAHSFRTGVQSNREAGTLHSVTTLSPRLRERLPAAEVVAALRDYAARAPGPALIIVGKLPDEYAALLSPEEVRILWERTLQSAMPSAPLLFILLHIPESLRPWTGPDDLLAAMADPKKGGLSNAALDALERIPEEMRERLPEAALERFIDGLPTSDLRSWLQHRFTRMDRGDTSQDRWAMGLVFSRYGVRNPATVLQWLRDQKAGARACVPHERTMEVWRRWLTWGSDHEIARSLRWAGVPLPSALAEKAETLRPAPRPLRPRAVRDEAHRALCDALLTKPTRALALAERIPVSVRPALARCDLQAAWTELLHLDQPLLALELLEAAPEEIRPAPASADLLRLLSSELPEVRLAALRAHARAALPHPRPTGEGAVAAPGTTPGDPLQEAPETDAACLPPSAAAPVPAPARRFR